jgi:hypothetical protein
VLQRSFEPSRLIDECLLEISALCGNDTGCRALRLQLRDFIASGESLGRITRLDGDTLFYESESFIPPRPDPAKPGIFFIVGNPAPDSVARRCMYAYEGSRGRQHRFWKVLHSTGVLRFSQPGPGTCPPEEKMRQLFAGEYDSPFNTHVIPFFSLPSPAAGPWGGVTGLRRLFGRYFAQVLSAERAAVRRLLDDRVREGDSILVLQKDAYLALRGPQSPGYDTSLIRKQALHGPYGSSGARLSCIPPTRLLYSRVTRDVLLTLAQNAAAQGLNSADGLATTSDP